MSVPKKREPKNSQTISIPLHDSFFLRTKQAQDKHNVPASFKKVFRLSHIINRPGVAGAVL